MNKYIIKMEVDENFINAFEKSRQNNEDILYERDITNTKKVNLRRIVIDGENYAFKYKEDKSKYFSNLWGEEILRINDDYLKEIIYYENLQRIRQHPNIPKIYQVMHFGNYIGFAMDIYVPITRIEPEDFQKFMYDLLHALAYIHSLGILHGDIKTDNIMFYPKTNNYMLIDFDRALYYAFTNKEFEYKANPHYMVSNLYDTKSLNVDTFALGITAIIYLLDKLINYADEKNGEERLKGYEGQITDLIGAEGYDLLSKMIKQNVEQIIPAQIALFHPYLSDMKDKKVIVATLKDFEQIIPFIKINFLDKGNYTPRMYHTVVEWLSEVAVLHSNVFDPMTFLLAIQIFKRFLNTDIKQERYKLQMYATCCMIISSCFSSYSALPVNSAIDLNDMKVNVHSEQDFINAIYLILRKLDWQPYLIPYFYFYQNKSREDGKKNKLAQVIFICILSWNGNSNSSSSKEKVLEYNLKDFTDYCIERAQNPYDDEYFRFKDWNYDRDDSILDNVKTYFIKERKK